ncbi:hypothetical protein C8R46DRAFT_280310 [Mycena filopes]|nr:hypothetical protein C8R46DRAFT_280310 [Mycena filopes]
MHRCLLLSEVFHMMCQHLVESSNLGSLAALAVTCKAFEAIALDVLWLEQTSLVPLGRCMPSTLWVAGKMWGPLARPILPTELTRLAYYSQRVKIFRGHIFEEYLFDPTVAYSMTLIFPQSLVFPNLHTLDWRVGARYFAHWLPIFLGPKITSVSLKLRLHRDATIPTLSLLARLPIQYPSLRHTAISFSRLEPTSPLMHTIERTVSNAVLGWHKLFTLDVGTLCDDAWVHVSELPYLHVLKIGTLDDRAAASLKKNTKGCAYLFPSLGALHIGRSTIEACTDLLRCMSCSPLEVLRLGLSRASTMHRWHLFYAAIPSASRLRTIRVSQNPDYSPITAPDASDLTSSGSQAIIPLLSFPNITQIELEPPLPICLKNDALRLLGAWSHLHTLDLGSCLTWQWIDGLRGLIPFAEHCSQLQYLRVYADASQSDFVPTADELLGIRLRGVVNTNLQRLKVEASPIREDLVFATANFLSTIFPQLASISSVNPARKLWDRVARQIPQFVAVHKGDEAYWMARSSESTAESLADVSDTDESSSEDAYYMDF